LSGSVNTTFAGETAEEDQQGTNATGLLIAIAFFVASPVISLTAVATWFTFSWGRIKRSVIASFLGLYLIVAAFFIVPIVQLFIGSWLTVFPNILAGKIGILPGILTLIVHQIPLGLPIGILVGLAYASWRWFQRPVWLETKFRITPWELYRRKKNIAEIQTDKNGPMNGSTLGITEIGKKIIQTDKEAAAHTLVVGAAGAGKTTTLMSKARDSIRRGQGMVFIDLKGGPDVPILLNRLAERYDRKFTHWLMQPKTQEYTGPDKQGPAYYDPLARGEATRRKDLLIASRQWSEEHYKIQASSYLQMLFSVLIGNPKKETSTFSDIVTLLNPVYLQERAIPLGSDPAYHDIVAGIDELNDAKISKTKLDAIEGLKSQLEVILHSVAGPWLQIDKLHKHNINLKEAAHTGEIIVFSLDSSNYQELSALVANLIIQDLKTVSSELRDDPASKPFQVFIDEFSAIGSDNIIGLINKSRDANMPVTLSTQALGDLRKVDATFLDQVLGIINSFIIHRANTEEDAKVYSGLTGTIWKKKFRQSVEHSSNLFGLGRGSGTGSGTVEDVEEFRVMPSEVQELGMGEMIYLTKSPLRLERLLVIPETEGMTGYNNASNFRVSPTDVKTSQEAFTVPILHSGVDVIDEESLPQLASPYQSIEKGSDYSRKSDPNKLKDILNIDSSNLLPEGRVQKPAAVLPKLAPSTFNNEAPRVDIEKPVIQKDARPFPPKFPSKVSSKEEVKVEEKKELPSSVIKPTTPKPTKKDDFSF